MAKKWKGDYEEDVCNTIEFIYTHLIYPFTPPVIKEATIVDKFIAKMQFKRGWWVLGDSHFFREPVTIEHVVKYLQGENEIYTWNADFIYMVQQECKRVKEVLVGKEHLQEFEQQEIIKEQDAPLYPLLV